MIIRIDGLKNLAASHGYRIDAVWSNGTICFDLVRLTDEQIVLEAVGTMDIECYLAEGRSS